MSEEERGISAWGVARAGGKPQGGGGQHTHVKVSEGDSHLLEEDTKT